MNPELRRHAWQDLRLHELLVTPMLIGLLAGTWLAASSAPANGLAWGATSLFVTVTLTWGGMRAFTSVSDEVRDRTWDFQRMTALPPAHIALGKVFGAPLLQWYAGFWCLLVFALAAPRAGMFHVTATVVGLVAMAVLMHALGVTASVLGARNALGPRSRRASGVALLLVLFYLPPVGLLLGGGSDRGAMSWWGLALHPLTFTAASAVAFAGWALLWACRAMARELREPARYGASAAFAAFFGLWVAGQQAAHVVTAGLGAAAFAFICATYAGVVSDPLTRVGIARLRRATAPVERVPGWAIDAAAAVVLALAAYATAAVPRVPLRFGWEALAMPLLVATVALMAVRDAAIVACFTLSPGLRRPVARALFYIALADFLLPFVFFAIGAPQLARFAMPLLAFVSPNADPLVPMALHAGLALAALAVRIRMAASRTG
jgi:hypothetical protein